MTARFDWAARTSVRYGPGVVSELGEIARAMGWRRAMLVADAGIVAAGHAGRAQRALQEAGVGVAVFSEFGENPTSRDVEAGCRLAKAEAVDGIVGVGGGSSLDCAKGINFLVTNGGHIQDYWGWDKAGRPMLEMIGVPTTTGTGSEAQSYALISDSEAHTKMAIGAPGAAFRHVLLDPELAATQPRPVLAAAGYDAISHAVESLVTTKRNLASDALAREAWRLLEGHFERLLAQPGDVEAAGAMQVGAYLAGAAIELSMLGAAHACANPLTARYGTVHGEAIALMLEPVVRWNAEAVGERYRELHPALATRLGELAMAASLPRRLREAGVEAGAIPGLAAAAAQQWTGRFNPRPLDQAAAEEIYRCVW